MIVSSSESKVYYRERKNLLGVFSEVGGLLEVVEMFILMFFVGFKDQLFLREILPKLYKTGDIVGGGGLTEISRDTEWNYDSAVVG